MAPCWFFVAMLAPMALALEQSPDTVIQQDQSVNLSCSKKQSSSTFMCWYKLPLGKDSRLILVASVYQGSKADVEKDFKDRFKNSEIQGDAMTLLIEHASVDDSGTHALTHRRKPVEQSKCTSCFHAGVLPCCSQTANGLLTVQALSQCFAHLQRDSPFSHISLPALPLSGGGLFPWFSTGSLGQSWSMQVRGVFLSTTTCFTAHISSILLLAQALQQSPDTVVREGDSVTLNCSKKVNAFSAMYWYKLPLGKDATLQLVVYSVEGGMAEIENQYRNHFKSHGTKGSHLSVEIDHAFLNDSGTYFCAEEDPQ
ncbi:hypothetical protein Q9233_013492 [Columba guinea]|nr:hypothetical protein Q9233_013492 [Columba guinea]